MMSSTSDLLTLTLAIAVPIAAEQYQRFPERWELDRELIISYSDVFAGQGDELLFRQEGVTGPLFAKLAHALAWLSFLPNGVKFNGVLYESKF